jgi:hypothetical protein
MLLQVDQKWNKNDIFISLYLIFSIIKKKKKKKSHLACIVQRRKMNWALPSLLVVVDHKSRLIPWPFGVQVTMEPEFT